MRLTLFLILTLALLAASAAEIVYHFVDEQGVPHFSNIPNDRRYQPLGRTLPVAGAPAPALVKARPAPAPVVETDPIVELEEGEAIEVEIENDDP